MSSHQFIDLFRGWPAESLLPTAVLQEASREVLADTDRATEALLYGPASGETSLKKALTTYLSQFYSSPWTKPSRLTVTAGASASLANILQVYTDPGYTKNVIMVTPTYFLATRIFEDNGFAGRLKGVPEDEEGLDIDRLREILAVAEMKGPRGPRTKRPLGGQKLYRYIFYCVPTFANPSGKVISLRRRQQLVDTARVHDALIITDDVYDMLHWNPSFPGKAVMPRLVDIDHAFGGGVASDFGHVVSNGTFSKLLGPGLRTGWTESTAQFARGLSRGGSLSSGGSPSQFTAAIVAEALTSGSLQAHLEGVLLPSYRDRAMSAVKAVNDYLVPHGAVLDAKESKSHSEQEDQKKQPAVQGGYFLYVHLPQELAASKFAEFVAHDQNVSVASGEIFEVSGEERMPIPHSLRICFAWEEDEDTIVEAQATGSTPMLKVSIIRDIDLQ
ncbi:Valine--pyruvate aminotransferase [Exophiala xenobiotica]|uniref:Valine--pyruvate aminotransferase n=1 Tax=Vermiconidia calcicola TaxID=1690605 RepID=A0AAV9Q0A1_9PEZI|nr:Valine--pyruvate aminotransferase [Exophiala xenobiotica]KAK5287054.1 Valine--pyruvate aminotransferase [Exophiala xenobiotica]KAK5300048.1 Valine--pyruvate aminotransferase [Exophiala xenobiotica]KAK5339280.1 Valine--pyruvate aminotransferase [Exophiala xenobiotica]KAK5531791.1 Valine--pyruvate aminotransferase [Vermiconidia calcicola]